VVRADRTAPVTSDNGLVEVRLIGLPVRVHAAASEHMNGLQREFELIRHHDTDTGSVPHRLAALIEQLNAEFGGVGEQPVDELDAAVDRGDDTIDLTYRIPRSAGPASERLGAMLDEVDDYCRARGHLLTLVTPPEALTYRQWFLGEFIRQTAGQPPLPWDRFQPPSRRPDRPVTAPNAGRPRLPEGWDLGADDDGTTVKVTGALDLASAPPLRDVLVEVIEGSGPVTVDLSGCDFLDSVGVSVLLAGLKRAIDQDLELRFVLSPMTERVLGISGVLDRITIVDAR
jgi:anti-anti-sigma factor